MKSFCIFALGLLAGYATASADLTIVEAVEGGDAPQHITMKVKGDKARVDVSSHITTILDAKTGDLTNVLHDKKMVMHISGEKAKAMAEMAKSFVKDEVPDQPLPKPSGKTEKINGYDTVEYVTDSPKFHASYWVATTYPDYQNILRQMGILQKGAFASITKGMPDYQALPGLPLRTQLKIPGQADFTSTIESLSQTAIPDSDFTVPAGYSQMAMPDFLGGQSPNEKSAKPKNP
jgi:hypothetical protein